MDNVKSSQSIKEVNDLYIEIKYKTGFVHLLQIPLGKYSEVFDSDIIRSDVLQLIQQAFSYGEDAFLVLPVEDRGVSHIFLDPASLDYIRTIDYDPR